MVQRLEELDREELVWDEIGKLHAHHGDVPVEIRLLKLTEEVGEVADAFLGVHGLNKRKGVCRSRDDLLDELADVIITAAVAMSGITSNVDEARSHLERRLATVTERAGLLPEGDRLPSWVSCVDVVDGSVLGDAEDAEQVDRVGGVAGLVQDAVLPQPVRADAERLEHGPDHGRADWADIGGSLLADQQVRVAAVRPALAGVIHPSLSGKMRNRSAGHSRQTRVYSS